MFKSTLIVSTALILLPTMAFAQGSDCPLHKRLAAQNTLQTAEVAPVTLTPFDVETSHISTPRQVVATPIAPSQVVTTPVAPSQVLTYEDSVDVPVETVQLAQNNAQASSPSSATQYTTVSPHADWTAILQKYVSPPDTVGLTHFNYAGLKADAADRAKLDAYIESLKVTDPAALSRDEAIVYYANFYNVLTIDLILQNYPLGSIRKAQTYNGAKVSGFTGPWKKVKTSINGDTISLDEIEHKILRVQYPSPYVHYMVNCASVGCPNLLDSAWDVETYESERKKAASAYINSPRGVVITPKGLKISSIYKWFKEDFGGKSGVLEHIRKYADADLAAAIDGGAKIVDYDYDWSLNE